MNSLIKEQLKKVKRAALPPYDDNTTSLYITKGIRTAWTQTMAKRNAVNFEIGSVLNVEVDKELVDPSKNWYQTIHGNWNGGNGLSERRLRITVDKIIGKMIHFSAVGLDDPGYTWQGFIPKANMVILEGEEVE